MFETDARVRSILKNIHPYEPGVSEDTLRKQFGDRTLVKLNSNENALGPSPRAIQAIQDELFKLHLYPDGTSELLRRAIAQHHAVKEDEVFVGNGSDDIIKLLSETFLDAGDEIVTPFPSFSQYGFGAEVMNATICPVPLRENFSYDIEAMLDAVTERTKIMYLCTPNNPTGTILEQAEFDWLMDRLPAHVFVVVDLAYDNYATSPQRFQLTADALTYPNVAYLHTFSKLYGLAGLRVGYALGNRDVWRYVHRVREPFNVNRLAQRAGAAALTDTEHVRDSRALGVRSRLQYASLEEHGFEIVPTDANFLLVKTGSGLQTFEQLRADGILVRAGYPGLDSYVRITFGLDEENVRCIEGLLTHRKQPR